VKVFETKHPENLYCPMCGSDTIFSWPELSEWDTWDDKKKSEYETCACCGYNVNEIEEEPE
jgi:hypothetical protein